MFNSLWFQAASDAISGDNLEALLIKSANYTNPVQFLNAFGFTFQDAPNFNSSKLRQGRKSMQTLFLDQQAKCEPELRTVDLDEEVAVVVIDWC